jgi:hypothetical protein
MIQEYSDAILRYDAVALDKVMNDEYQQAGTVAWSADEYLSSETGKANAKVGAYEVSKHPESFQAPSWGAESSLRQASSRRPLAGLRVVDLTRVIAGPVIGRSLAEMGASVMRVTHPGIPDVSSLHPDLNWGKWNCHLDLKKEADRERLVELIKEADVVIDGYRPSVMERLGFSRQVIFDLVKDRSYGIIHVRENCYGWHGPWVHRSGWQQNSDAVSYLHSQSQS